MLTHLSVANNVLSVAKVSRTLYCFYSCTFMSIKSEVNLRCFNFSQSIFICYIIFIYAVNFFVLF